MISVLGAGHSVIPVWAPESDFCFSNVPSMRGHSGMCLLTEFAFCLVDCAFVLRCPVAACPLSTLCCRMNSPRLSRRRSRAGLSFQWLHRNFGTRLVEEAWAFSFFSFLRTKADSGPGPLALTLQPHLYQNFTLHRVV